MTKKNGHNHEPLAHMLPEMQSLMQEGQWDVLKDCLEDVKALDLLASWHHFSPQEKAKVFKLLPTHSALVLFESLEPSEQLIILNSMEDVNASAILENIPSKDVADLFQSLPKRTLKKMVKLVKREDSVKKIEYLMQYETGSAGSLMHPEFLSLTPQMTVQEALSLIQSISGHQKRRHILRGLYVTSSEGVLLGALNLDALVSAVPHAYLEDIMTTVEPFKIEHNMDQETVAALFSKYNLVSAPVVEPGTDRLIGIILIDDIVDVISQEASEDMAKIVGTQVEEFTERSILRVVWYRSPWLLATLVTEFAVSVVIRHFEFALSRIIALASFLPIIAAMGGNVGSQSAMITVRTMVMGKAKNPMPLVLREISIGFTLGIFYGLFVGLIAYFFYSQAFGITFSFVVGVSVCLAMTLASAAGSLGPVVFQRFGIDPATAIGPMVTTVTDFFGILAYFLIAVTFLIGWNH